MSLERFEQHIFSYYEDGSNSHQQFSCGSQEYLVSMTPLVDCDVQL